METQLILEYLYSCTYTLIANPGYTMADIPMLLQDDQCRSKLVANVTDSDVQRFWKQHNRNPPGKQSEDISSTLRRVKLFLQPLTRPIVGQSTTTIDFIKIMDERKILLVKLTRQLDAVTSLIGSMIVALILNASASRQTQRQFHLYADEFQRFATEDFATLIEEARYAGIGVTMAHQNRAQLELSEKQAGKQLKARTLNVDSLVVFYVPTDAKDLAGQFDTTPPPAREEDIEIIDGTEPILTPRSDAIDWLLAGRTHGHPTVNTFISKWNMGKIEQTRQGKTQLRNDALWQQWATQFLDDLNTLCYQAMVYKNPATLSIAISFLQLMKTFVGEIFYGGKNYNQLDDGYLYYIDSITSILPAQLWQSMTLLWLINLLSSSQWGTLIDRDYHKKKLIGCLQTAIWYVNDTPSEVQTQLAKHFQTAPYTNTAWLSLDLNRLQWVLTTDLSNLSYRDGRLSSSYRQVKKLVGGQETSWYTPYTIEREIDRIMASPYGIIQSKQVFISFLSDLLAMLRVLAIDDFAIRDKSGLEQPHKKTQHIVHAQQTRADKEKENENQLLQLVGQLAKV